MSSQGCLAQAQEGHISMVGLQCDSLGKQAYAIVTHLLLNKPCLVLRRAAGRGRGPREPMRSGGGGRGGGGGGGPGEGHGGPLPGSWDGPSRGQPAPFFMDEMPPPSFLVSAVAGGRGFWLLRTGAIYLRRFQDGWLGLTTLRQRQPR